MKVLATVGVAMSLLAAWRVGGLSMWAAIIDDAYAALRGPYFCPDCGKQGVCLLDQDSAEARIGAGLSRARLQAIPVLLLGLAGIVVAMWVVWS